MPYDPPATKTQPVRNAAPAAMRASRSERSERALRAVVGILVIVMMVACGSAPKRPTATSRPGNDGNIARPSGSASQLANAVLFRAIALVGTPYRWGGNTPESGFDCSGLVGYVFRDAAGLALPRRSSEIAQISAPKVKRDQLVSGDLLFFSSGRQIDHVGIYVGEGRFVHAPNSGGTVRLDALSGPYWRDAFQFGRRALH